ncbi:MAG: DNA polymerase, partial [Firmicutes bacterium]|nr:DNA polymerase [Bacillota bacterium]
RLDTRFVDNALIFNDKAKEDYTAEALRITGLENPNSVAQLKKWFEEETGEEIVSLNKKDLQKFMTDKSGDVERMLQIRQALGKSSTAKYKKMKESVCSDGRIRGLLQFYGAGRTGRWAGRIVQPQNLPQNHLKNIADVKSMVIEGDYEYFSMLYDVPQTLSELIRTALIPSEGKRFIVSDFSAIEARVIAWLADEKWRIEVFGNNKDIYCASASQMFGVPVEKHGVNAHLRQKGKIAELALGYGGSVGALISMGALDMGLTEDELPAIVSMWRGSNTNITRLWKTIENAAMSAIRGHPVQINKGIKFYREKGFLFVKLPSGRNIAYPQPAIGKNERFGSDAVFYMGIGQKSKKWERIESFGGKLTENIVQAIARDCLAESMIRLENKGYEINFTVHDEVILDVPNDFGSLEEVTGIMGGEIEWAKGLELKADGYECDFYLKD